MAGPNRGLQAERTTLSWERTALALLANVALLQLRHARGTGSAFLAPAGLALVLALVCAVLGARRAARIRRSDGPIPVARTEVVVLGVAVVLLCVSVLVGLLLAGRPGG